MIANSNLYEEQLLPLISNNSVVLGLPTDTNSVDQLDILVENSEVNALLLKVKQLKDLANVSYVSSFISSKMTLNFKDNTSLIMNLVHKFAHNSITYLDEEKVFQKKVKYNKRFFIPCVEHIFEYQVLKSYLSSTGISAAVYQYFKEFHFLMQDDLIDYFNLKFGTTFSTIHQLTDCDATQREQILKVLKEEPENQFLKKVNVQWHNFLGSIRQARIV